MFEFSKAQQLREDRRHKLEAWLAGGLGNRWSNDDGRFLRLEEFQFWSEEIQQAEREFFSKIDSEYEQEKSKIIEV